MFENKVSNYESHLLFDLGALITNILAISSDLQYDRLFSINVDQTLIRISSQSAGYSVDSHLFCVYLKKKIALGRLML